ncbi:flagellar basal body-associated FliL family protein [Marinovum sp.]|uniref:flagellar basal body-associated FliL family protein n=1 Tax=Marinovum sp. TaxID=2024839 RepID=UPI002B2768D9|nr:flagellar basal body-associated FliL family protein [Marinovum sp.]
MGKILPLLLALIGIGAGVGAGILLKPAPEQVAVDNPCGEVAPAHDMPGTAEEPVDVEYIKLNNQFIVPVVSEAKVASMMVIALSVEVPEGRSEEVYSREPKLRDAFLQVFFDHANLGGFTGTFTSSRNLDVLRRALRETAQSHFGDLVQDVLITDIARQDV